jgi:hypothetical protein
MYWIYLILFTLIVFIPTSVRNGFYIFDTTQTQEFAILLLGSLGFFLFLLMEKKLKKNQAEKSKIQGQVNSMAKDLKHSYSYIGEINRKLDILENIALGYPESSKLTHKNELDLYDSIMEAIRLFGKSDEFALRFVQLPKYDLLKEISSKTENTLNFSLKGRELEINYYESEEYIAITSPKTIDNIFSYILIKKKTASQKIEDTEMMKTLAAQALFIFMFMRNKKQIKCVI